METLDTICMLVSKLQNGVAYRWNRKALMLQRSQQRETSLKDFIEFFWSTIQSSQEKLELHMLEKDDHRKRRSNSKKCGSFVTNINHHQPEDKIKSYFAVTSTIWTTVRNT